MINVLNYFLTLKEKKLEPHWVFQQFFLFILGEGSIFTPTGKVGHFACHSLLQGVINLSIAIHCLQIWVELFINERHNCTRKPVTLHTASANLLRGGENQTKFAHGIQLVDRL